MSSLPVLRLVVAAILAGVVAPLPARGQGSIPVEFRGDRPFALPVTESGDTLRFHLHTGGPGFVYADQAMRLKLTVEASPLDSAGADTVFFARWPTIREPAGMPAPAGKRGAALPLLFHTSRAGVTADWTGQLGAGWFASRVWTLDYPGERLVPGGEPLPEGSHEALLALNRSPGGGTVPSVAVTVAGDTLDLLVGTGAMIFATDEAARAMGEGPVDRGMSFVEPETFHRWSALHPGWRVVHDADRAIPGTSMIEVPAVEIGDLEVGPVWFAARVGDRPENVRAAHEPGGVDGVLGGSALRYLRITLDYPAGRALFAAP